MLKKLVSGMAIGTVFTLLILPVIYLLVAVRHRPESNVGYAAVATGVWEVQQ